MRLLLDYGANVNVESATKDTPLHCAAQNRSVEAIRVLLEYGASIYAVNEARNAPRGVAARGSLEKITELELPARVKIGRGLGTATRKAGTGLEGGLKATGQALSDATSIAWLYLKVGTPVIGLVLWVVLKAVLMIVMAFVCAFVLLCMACLNHKRNKYNFPEIWGQVFKFFWGGADDSLSCNEIAMWPFCRSS